MLTQQVLVQWLPSERLAVELQGTWKRSVGDVIQTAVSIYDDSYALGMALATRHREIHRLQVGFKLPTRYEDGIWVLTGGGAANLDPMAPRFDKLPSGKELIDAARERYDGDEEDLARRVAMFEGERQKLLAEERARDEQEITSAPKSPFFDEEAWMVHSQPIPKPSPPSLWKRVTKFLRLDY